MANLGTIQGVVSPSGSTLRLQPLSGVLKPGVCTGSITGSVSVIGAMSADILVLLYERGSFFPIRSARTNSSGDFTFSELYPGVKYFAIAFGPDGGVTYNAIIFDKITPV